LDLPRPFFWGLLVSMKHPGIIVVVDGDTNRVLRRDSVDDVPESLHFVETTAGLVPVVRIVAFDHGDRRTIYEYGPDGELLRSRIQTTGAST